MRCLITKVFSVWQKHFELVGGSGHAAITRRPAAALFAMFALAILSLVSERSVSAPFKVEGSFTRTTIVSGAVVEVRSNKFTVLVGTNAYRIETFSPDFGPISTLRVAAQGNAKETISIQTGIVVPDNGKGKPQEPNGDTLKTTATTELVNIETGGYPTKGTREVQVLWLSYVAADFFGSNWNDAVISSPYPKVMTKKILPAKTVSMVTNVISNDQFIQSAAFYCDPANTLPDGRVGTLAAPYDQGYRCADYEVTDWKKLDERVFPAKAQYRILQTRFGKNGYADITNADDVITFIKYDISTLSVAEVPAMLGDLRCRDQSERVADWRILDFTPTSYYVTNSQWRTLADLAQDSKYALMLQHKSEIIKLETEKQAGNAAKGSKPVNKAARFVIVALFSLSFAIPLVWFVAYQKNKNKMPLNNI